MQEQNAPLEEGLVPEKTFEKVSKSWLRRTFGPMKEGSIRGNIFLMMVTTLGSAFFYLPLQAKKTGIILTSGILTFVMLVSYYCSTLLFLGFEKTKGTTYDLVMKDILGLWIGFISNIMIFIHTFASVISVWLFSAEYLS